MKDLVSEFKSFILKGSVVELAIGVVVGTAFNTVVDSLVKDIILGAIATIANQPDFSSFAFGAIKWGSFVNSLVNLLIVGFSVFMTVKFLSKIGALKKADSAEAGK
jgi:large conductance mechanosensitive channel